MAACTTEFVKFRLSEPFKRRAIAYAIENDLRGKLPTAAQIAEGADPCGPYDINALPRMILNGDATPNDERLAAERRLQEQIWNLQVQLRYLQGETIEGSSKATFEVPNSKHQTKSANRRSRRIMEKGQAHLWAIWELTDGDNDSLEGFENFVFTLIKQGLKGSGARHSQRWMSNRILELLYSDAFVREALEKERVKVKMYTPSQINAKVRQGHVGQAQFRSMRGLAAKQWWGNDVLRTEAVDAREHAKLVVPMGEDFDEAARVQPGDVQQANAVAAAQQRRAETRAIRMKEMEAKERELMRSRAEKELAKMKMPTAPDGDGDGDDAEEEEELARYAPRGIEMLKAHLRAEEAAAWKREDEKRKQKNLPRRQRQQPRQPQPEGELEEEARVMWSRDGEPQDPHDTQAFAGACVHHLLIVSPGSVLLGFAKVLVTEHEAFIEEVHVSADARGQGLSYHIIAELGKRAELSADALARLQVSVFNDIAKKSYANITFKAWEIPEGGVWTKADEPQKDCEMMATTVGTMTRAARLRAASNPLRADLKVMHFVDGEVVAEPVDLEADRDEDRPARTAEEKNVISYGTRNLSDPLCAQMVGRSTWNWPLKVGVSNASSFGYHLSCDAGRVKGGNRLMRQWSIVQVSPKCYGVKVSARRSRTPPARARHALTPSLPPVRSGIAHRAGR